LLFNLGKFPVDPWRPPQLGVHRPHSRYSTAWFNVPATSFFSSWWHLRGWWK